ncbi:MAG: hypothetical protein C4547_07030 [Phycisphaerales bacterium]|nr:MAG: hypothetical protein C4547_07030 [Phycisphaerales bacterium]
MRSWLMEEDAAVRTRTLSEIATAVEGDVDRAARVLACVSIWDPVEEARGELAVPDAGVRVLCALPADYDPTAGPFPLVICLPPARAAPASFLDTVASRLATNGGGAAIWIAVGGQADGMFPADPAKAGTFALILREAMSAFHIDAAAVYLVGSGEGADAAFSLALAYPDSFAGLGAIGGYARVPLPEYAYSLLSENLGSLAIASAWWLADADDPGAIADLTRRDLFIAAHNRALRSLAATALPRFDGAEVNAAPAAWNHVAGALRRWLVTPPPKADPRTARGWIRFPQHGRIGWLEAEAIDEPIWTSQQLTVAVGDPGGGDAFVRGVLEGRLAHLAGRIDGQEITIDAHRCLRVGILLRRGLIDFTRPIRVTCNGILRYDGPVERRLTTMMETARRDLDFSNPAWARLSFRMDGPALQRD